MNMCGRNRKKWKTTTVTKKLTVRDYKVLKKTGNDVTGKEPEESLEERSGQGANLSMVSGHSRAL